MQCKQLALSERAKYDALSSACYLLLLLCATYIVSHLEGDEAVRVRRHVRNLMPVKATKGGSTKDNMIKRQHQQRRRRTPIHKKAKRGRLNYAPAATDSRVPGGSLRASAAPDDDRSTN